MFIKVAQVRVTTHGGDGGPSQGGRVLAPSVFIRVKIITHVCTSYRSIAGMIQINDTYRLLQPVPN